MCGIAGFYQRGQNFTGNPIWQKKLENMRDSIVHRGRNDQGSVLYANCGLAQTRLSIIDLAGGHQPMTKTQGKYGCSIVYNGELYNTNSLKDVLSAYPLTWETTCDTEVILNGYIAMGPDFVKLLNGIFSFAIYQEKEDSLFLARDPLGVKPLFYKEENGILVFSSEQKALFAFGIKPEADRESFCEIIGLGPARSPGHGVFLGIRELLPGHMMLQSPTGSWDKAYFTLTGDEHTDTYDQTVEKVRWLVEDSTRRQMVSDVPICTFLSGGLDSSLISAICQKQLQKEGKRLNTFSFDFVDNDIHFKPNAFQTSQDRPFVDIMVESLGSNHVYLECDNRTQAEYLYRAVDARDLPNMADVESSLLYFCSLVAKEYKVVLTGETADEIFGGYPWFHREEMWKQNLFPWSYDIAARTALFKKEFIGELGINAYVQEAYDSSIAQTPRFMGDNDTEKRRREVAWLNIQWFMPTLLNRMDRTSMYSGLEARVPYADHRILQYVYNIPWEMKCKDGVTKSLLVEAGVGLLHPKVLYRKKSPYPKTYDVAYEKLLGERLLERIHDPASPLCHIIDIKKAEQFIAGGFNYGKPWYGQLMAGPQMLAYLLQIDYWMQKYKLSA